MRKFIHFLSVLLVPVVLIFMAYHTGSPGGKSGSPGNGGSTCTDCHTGANNPVTGWISTNIPPEGYTPGQTYNVTAHGTHQGVVLFGFELTVEDEQGNYVGTLSISDPLQTQYTSGDEAITHTEDGIAPAGSGKTWNMSWTAPATTIDNVTFYAAFNAADGNQGTGGDTIYTSTLIVQPDLPGSLASITPNTGQQDKTVSTTIVGTNVYWNTSPPTAVSLNNHANPLEIIEATTFSVINMDTLSADFDIPDDATLGMWDLKVDDLILANAFEVLLGDPKLVGMDPSLGRIGETVTSTITGLRTQFSGTPDVSITFTTNPSEEIIGENVSVISNTEIEADFTIPSGTSVGFWDLHVDDLSLVKAFKVDFGIGITALEALENVKVWPNPTSGIINIENLDNARIFIYNTTGEEIYSRDHSVDNVKIDLRGLPEGIYFMRLENEAAKSVRKIIISR